jgi:Tfp pilus assembly protein PilF
LAIRYNNLGLVQSKSQMLVNAEQSFRQGLTIQEELVRQYPHDANLLSSIGGIYNNIAMVFGQLGRDEEAATAYTNAIRYQRQAHESAPQVTRFREFLAKHYDNYGPLLRRLDREDEARRIDAARKDLMGDESDDTLRRADELQSNRPHANPTRPAD